MTTSFSDDATGAANRILPRHVFETRILIRQRDGKRLSLPCWVRNLSEGGVGAFVAEALTLDESVTLEIPLPVTKLVIPAKVVRVLGTDYGFQFTALSAEQRTIIRALLKGQPPIPCSGTR
jgi:hypothetical protein